MPGVVLAKCKRLNTCKNNFTSLAIAYTRLAAGDELLKTGPGSCAMDGEASHV